MDLHFSRVRASLSQKLTVPSDPDKRIQLSLWKVLSVKKRTACRECAMHRMEVYVIHSVD